MSLLVRIRVIAIVCLAVSAATANAQKASPDARLNIADVLASRRPADDLLSVQPLERVALVEAPLTDLDVVRAEDEINDALGEPPRFALPQPVFITPDLDGDWEEPQKGVRVWRLRVASPGALSLNLGFGRFHLPKDAHLLIYAADRSAQIRPFTYRDNADHGQLWTPVLLTDEVVIELAVSASAAEDVELELSSINAGYRFFGETGGERSGSCNVDVICPEGDDWRDEIPSVATYSTGGSRFCSGVMVNNTAYDQKPYFLTANHCGMSSGNAPSIVVYWNFENSTCRAPGSPASGGAGDGPLNEFTTGGTWRAGYSPSDVTLLELSSQPNPAWQISYAGWDATGATGTSAVGIHHPNTDEKRISFENDPTTTTDYLGTSVPGDGTHVRVTDWDLGTTEPGSSGSPLFNQDHRIVGQLHGGGAACGNDDSDYYGKLAVSWTGGGTASTRLSNWLDPTNTGALVLDTLSGLGMTVAPGGDVLHVGLAGGPFTQPSIVYTLTNPTPDSLDYEVSLFANIGVLLDGAKDPISGTIPGLGGSTTVTVSLGPDIDQLPAGVYGEVVVFEDTTNDKTTMITHTIEIGQTKIAVTPAQDFVTGGPIGGPFNTTADYTVTSERPTPVDVQVSADQPWLLLDGTAGPLTLNLSGTGDADGVTVSIGPAANALPPGPYHGTVTFTNLAGGAGSTTRDVTLEVGSLLHAATDLPKPITDNNVTISTISVPDDFCIVDVDVNVDITHTYIGDLTIDVTAPSGTVVRLHDRTGGDAEDILRTYDDDGGGTFPDGPGALLDFDGENVGGDWTLTVRDNAFSDEGTLNSWSLKILVTEGDCPAAQLVHSVPLDTNPGWSVQGQWAFGQPTGSGGSSGSPDPSSGHTGTNVYGYNLNGDYPDDLGSTQYLTTTPFDCSEVTGARLKFWRWLGVESASFDHASIQASNNGTTWTTVWNHLETSSIDDGSWVQVVYDIAAVADGQSSVQLRWGMGSTDYSVTYCGWNIDDVEIWGVLPAPPPTWGDCMTGPDLGPYGADCDAFDWDFDGDVDLQDFASRQQFSR